MVDEPHERPSVLGALPAQRPPRLGRPRRPATRRARPAAVRSAAEPLHAAKPPPRPIGPPTGTELLTTSVRAVGELAQVGLIVGGHVLKRAVHRIPRP